MPLQPPSIPSKTETHERCRASARAAAALLGELWLAPRLDRGAGGMLRRDSGDSTEFHDHRLYTPGDDPRRINWAAYGRTGQLSLKLFRQEGRPLVDCLLDVSPSMWHPTEKAERTLELLYFIFESASAQQAGLQMWAISAATATRLPPALMAAGAEWVNHLPEPAEGGRPLEVDAIPLRAGSQRILLSDLLFPVEPKQLIGPLTARDGGASILAPWHAVEADPGWRGVCELDDTEAQLVREIEFDGTARRAYGEAYERHFRSWQDTCRRYSASLNRIPSDGELATKLAAALATLNPGSTC